MGADTGPNQSFLHDAGAEVGDDVMVVAEIEAVDDVGMEVARDEERCKAG